MRRGGSVSGTVSLVMIFCVLCLVVFATLTYVTADREQRLSLLTARRSEEYYAADAEAVRIIAALRSGGTPEGVALEESFDSSGTVEEFSVPINDHQDLLVRVRLTPEGSYRILRWEAAFTGGWQDGGITIWDGEMP